jgi:hypothetical protein
VREEWYKGLDSVAEPKRLWALWRESGAAALWLPELVEAYRLASPLPPPHDPVVFTAGLTTDPAGVLKRLKASNQEISRARAMTAAAQEPAATDPRTVRRWLALRGEAADDLMLLARYRRGAPAEWEEVVIGIRARGEATTRGKLAVTGDDLRQAGVAVGPELGRILEQLLDAVLEDPALNERESLLALVRGWK